MMDAYMQYDKSEPPKTIEIVKYVLGHGYTQEELDWVKSKGEVILKILCDDGYVILVREGYFSEFSPGNPRCQNTE